MGKKNNKRKKNKNKSQVAMVTNLRAAFGLVDPCQHPYEGTLLAEQN